MSDSFDFSSSSDLPKVGDAELQEFLLVENQKAQFTAKTHELTDYCWEKCIDKPSSKLDSKAETCMANCVGRFLDVSFLITNRFAQFLQRSAS